MLILSPSDLASFYRDQRKSKRLTQSAVSDEVALRQDTISSFENKANNVRLETLFKLLSALDLEMHIVPKGSNLDEREWVEKW